MEDSGTDEVLRKWGEEYETRKVGREGENTIWKGGDEEGEEHILKDMSSWRMQEQGSDKRVAERKNILKDMSSWRMQEEGNDKRVAERKNGENVWSPRFEARELKISGRALVAHLDYRNEGHIYQHTIGVGHEQEREPL